MDKFEKYNIENFPKDYLYIDEIKWDEDGLKINLSFERDKGQITLLFDSTVYFYKNTAESFKPMWWFDSREDYRPFYYSYDSEDIVNFKKEAEHVDDYKIIHFVIVGSDNVVDVLTNDLPKVQKRL